MALAARPDLDRVRAALEDADPAAVVDVDSSGLVLRVATMLEAWRVAAISGEAGAQVVNVQGVPSECCGGCGG